MDGPGSIAEDAGATTDETTWAELWERARRGYGVAGARLSVTELDQTLTRHVWFALFCEERCGCDVADKYFGPAVGTSLARLTALAESEWFVSAELFRSTTLAESARLNNYGYGRDYELFGVCFDAGGFALGRCTKVQWRVCRMVRAWRGRILSALQSWQRKPSSRKALKSAMAVDGSAATMHACRRSRCWTRCRASCKPRAETPAPLWKRMAPSLLQTAPASSPLLRRGRSLTSTRT
jgi:hypothetical protein